MDTRVEARSTAPRAVDLRRGRAPDIVISETTVFDFLLSVDVALNNSESAYDLFDIGQAWIDQARAALETYKPGALLTLGQYLGDARPTSLRSTLLSLAGSREQNLGVKDFLDWLAETPDLTETLLDQDGLGSEWTALLRVAQDELNASPTREPGAATQRLLDLYPRESRPSALNVLQNPDAVRAELISALWAWYNAVFATEEERLIPLIKREAEIMNLRKADTPPEAFIEREMRGVQWQRPAGLRRIVFAPSYFCRPAVFYHFWRGALTFCFPIEIATAGQSGVNPDPITPPLETLRFFEALGDGTRLRILRLLSEREMYLTELSERLKLTKATTKHHMVRLRAAGIVTVYERERLTYYALRPDVARRANQMLDMLLNMGGGAGR